MAEIISGIESFLTSYPIVGEIYTTIVRWVFPVLAIIIVVKCVMSLIRINIPNETWAYLSLPNGSQLPLNHWENVIGRAASSDVLVNFPSISRNHTTLTRNDQNEWTVRDLNSKSGTLLNGEKIEEDAPVSFGDVLTIGGVEMTFLPVPLKERKREIRKRTKEGKPLSPWYILALVTVFQVLTAFQLIVGLGDSCTPLVPLIFLLFAGTTWVYCLILRTFGQTGFEIEILAWFLCTIGLAVTASVSPSAITKQFFTIVLGMIGFLVIGFYLRDLNRTKKARRVLSVVAVVLFLINIIFGVVDNGAQNWIEFKGISLQPSELVKVIFVFVGAATVNELYEKKNLTYFMIFSAFCIGSLAILGDFGTAAIFFATFLVISFLRSGDFSKLVLIIGAAFFAGLMVLRFKPYVANRFSSWLHAWDYAYTSGGFQQTRTMSAAAGGGLVGHGAGNGWLSEIFAADTDLVFGVIAEEWGLIMALLCVFIIIAFALFSFRAIKAGRSGFYIIAACGATSLLSFQTMLNVCGSTDILPLTGVTFPFVSNGGTSMISAWCMLAFLKAIDTRQNASFAIRRARKKFLNGGLSDEEA